MGSLNLTTSNGSPNYLLQAATAITPLGDQGVTCNAKKIQLHTASDSVRLGAAQDVIGRDSHNVISTISDLLCQFRESPKSKFKKLLKKLSTSIAGIRESIAMQKDSLFSQPQSDTESVTDSDIPFYIYDAKEEEPVIGYAYRHSSISTIAIYAPESVAIQRNNITQGSVAILATEGNKYTNEYLSLAQSLMPSLREVSEENTRKVLEAFHKYPEFAQLIGKVGLELSKSRNKQKSKRTA